MSKIKKGVLLGFLLCVFFLAEAATYHLLGGK